MKMRMLHFAVGVALVVSNFAFAQSPSAEQTEVERDAATAEVTSSAEVDRWIAELNADRYAEREQASRKLFDAGPFAFDRLAEVADGRQAESAARAAAILERWGRDDDLERALVALEHLSSLQNQPAVRRRAIARLAEVYEQRALARLTEAGARVEMLYAGRHELKVVFSETWRGEGDEIKELRYLPAVRITSIYTPDLNANDLAVFADMPALARVELYGAEFSPEEVEELKKLAPHVEFDVRRGAMLGVRGGARGGPAEIDSVEPESAAERAGLQVGDVIHAINGKPVGDFSVLTLEIGKFKPGETATLEYERDGKRATMDVEFGRWK